MIAYLSKEELLKNRLQQILNSKNLDTQRNLIGAIAAELEIDSLTCAAALLHLIQTINPPVFKVDQKTEHNQLSKSSQPGIKMVRYRLDVGSKHQVTLEGLKKVLIEESGVDKNNISNVNIQGLYTLIELPDEMPPDIFQHLKSVEINQRKLDIRRVKNRNKKRGNLHIRRGRQHSPKDGNEFSDQANSKN
ncbi:MAG: DbpA RNA binding domain-containing protein [Gammaproteobacteria bacterium]